MNAIIELDGKRHNLNVPVTCSEVTFETFCEVQELEREYFDADTVADAVALLTAAMAKVYGDAVYKLPYGLPGDADESGNIISDGWEIAPGEDLSVLRCYAHFVTLFADFVPEAIPETFTLPRDGKTYQIEKAAAARVLEGRPLTTGEVLEVLEIDRRVSKAIEVTPKSFGNLNFTLGLTQVAILLRQPGEELPARKPDRDRFIAERQRLFAGVGMDVVLSLRFFFLNSLLEFNQIGSLRSFGKGPQRQLIFEQATPTKPANKPPRRRGR